MRSSLIVAVVGTILGLFNDCEALFGAKGVVVWKLALTYVVPYLGSTYGAVLAPRSRGQAGPHRRGRAAHRRRAHVVFRAECGRASRL